MAATRLSFSYPQEMKDKIQELAKEDNRTVSSYVQKVLSEHIESKIPVKNEVKNEGVKKKKPRPLRKRTSRI